MRIKLFPRDPSFKFISDQKRFIMLKRTTAIITNDDGSRETYHIPKGFSTDLASIPRMARSVIPQIGHHVLPAIFHDYCYRVGILSKKKSDRVFLIAMENFGVNCFIRNIMHRSVKYFGDSSYKG